MNILPKNVLEADAHNKWISKKVPYVKYNFSKEEFENALENLDRDFIKKGLIHNLGQYML